MALQKAKNKQKKCGTIKSHISFLYFIFLFKPPKNIASTNKRTDTFTEKYSYFPHTSAEIRQD